VLPPFGVDSFRRVQHLHVPSQRGEERGRVHAHGMPGTSVAGRQVYFWHRLCSRGRLEHVHVPIERLEERGGLHELGLPYNSVAGDQLS